MVGEVVSGVFESAFGGVWAEDLAQAVADVIEKYPADFQLIYENDIPLWQKMQAVAKKVYSASDVVADAKVPSADRIDLDDDGKVVGLF